MRNHFPLVVVVHTREESEHGLEAVAELGVHPAVDKRVVDTVAHGCQEYSEVDQLDIAVVEDILVDLLEDVEGVDW